MLWAALLALLYMVYRQLPLAQIAAVVGRLRPGSILILALANGVFLLLVNFRWWLLVRSMGHAVPLPTLMLYRLVGFGVSYFTPGPQFGGEPLQVHLLHSRQGLPLESAISSVFLDRLVDLLANFTFLFAGCLVVVFSGVLNGWMGDGIWLPALSLFLMPAGHLLALRLGRRPAAWLARRLPWQRFNQARAVIIQSEEQVARLVSDKPTVLGLVMLISILVWVGAVFEFWLCLRFLGIQTGWVETISALTAARFAFLAPIPGGLGVLETSQFFTAQLLGWGGAAGIAVSLVIRARDMFLALLGLGVGGFLYRSVLFSQWITKEKER